MLSDITAMLHRAGSSLDRRRLARWSALLLVFQIVLFAALAVKAYGLITPVKTPASTDFVSFFAAGSLANAGTPELAYDRAAHHAVERRIAGASIAYNYFYYPPIFTMLCGLLARLPYLAAFALFQAAGLTLYLLAAAKILGGWRWVSLLPMLAFPAVIWNIALGQTAFLTASLFAAATFLVDRRPVVAGVLFGAVCYKPHLGVLIPAALAAGQHWRAFAAATATVAGLILLSLLVFGEATWAAFLSAALGAAPVYEGAVKLTGYVTPFGAVRVLGGPPGLAFAAQALAALALAGFVALVWMRRVSLPVRAAALCAATAVVSPIAMWYDLLLAAVAAAWLYRGGKLTATHRPILMLLAIPILFPVGLGNSLHFPVAAFAALVFLAIVVRISWREMVQPAPAAANPHQAIAGSA